MKVSARASRPVARLKTQEHTKNKRGVSLLGINYPGPWGFHKNWAAIGDESGDAGVRLIRRILNIIGDSCRNIVGRNRQ